LVVLNSFATQCGFTAGSNNYLVPLSKREADPVAAAGDPASSNQAKFGGGYAGWSYPTTDDGGAVVAPSNGAAAAPQQAPAGGAAGKSGGGSAPGGAQPVFFSDAPRTSVQGLVAMTLAGTAAVGAGFLLM
jgi:hypothetical protein